MSLPPCNSQRASKPGVDYSRGIAAAALLLLVGLLGACGVLPESNFSGRVIPPLILDGEIYSYTPDPTPMSTEALLEVTPRMREFVQEQTRGANNPRNKLMSLHMAIKGQGGLAMQYDPFADGNARQAFERGTANCLSYAHMFVALAREAGLNARYQWVEVRPEWQRMGERVAVRLHVNVHVKTRDGSEYMVDIDPLSRSQVAGARLMKDNEGLALYYNNLAMNALSEDRPAEAWRQLVRGIEVAPKLSQLWVNLGAIYRYSGQYAEAEQAYFRALELDRSDRSAMNNLVVLYDLQGRHNESRYWLDRLSRYRDLNPYYHASLGDEAMRKEAWDEAYAHYAEARKLQPDDGQLIYSQGLAAHFRGDSKEAERLITRAIEKAVFAIEKERYRLELRTIREQQAGL
jgi:Flp pilus assembly protein TadD